MTRLDTGALRVAQEPDVHGAAECDGPRALLLEARDVPLGGVRAMEVHRLLPQRDLPMVGAWCFLDRFGPQTARMRVEPHPHIGLQTVTWPFEGDVRHRDAVGSDVVITRGQLNIMTSGEGISHSEYSVGEEPVALDALQLWVALPDESRHGGAAFAQHADLPVLALPVAPHAIESSAAGSATIVLGELGGLSSPAAAHTPIIGAEIRLEPGALVRIPLRPDWEHALVGLFGEAAVDASAAAAGAGVTEEGPSVPVTPERMLYLGTGRDHVDVAAPLGATLFLLGGEPFPDEIVMWWNFVGRSHEEIVEARDDWEARSPRFGHIEDHGDVRIPAPPLPAVRLTPRRRRI